MECTVCSCAYDMVKHIPTVLSCGHSFCKACLNIIAAEDEVKRCPSCRTNFSSQQTNYALVDVFSSPCKIIPITVVTPPEPYYKIWVDALRQNYNIPTDMHKILWQQLTEFLLIRREHPNVRPTHNIDAGWHTLLLMPKFAHFIHEQYGGIIDHTPLDAGPLNAQHIELQDQLYLVFFKRSCPWERTSIKDLVFVKTLSGRTLSIQYFPNMTVYSLKESVAIQAGIPPCQQTLLFAGSKLNNELTLDNYGIKKGNVVCLFLELRGC